MKVSQLKTFWIIFLACMYVIGTCGKAVLMQLFGKIHRSWVDKNIQIWTHRILNLVKVDCEVINPHGVKPIPGQPTIIMCNHASHFDIPLSFYAFPYQSIRMLAKKELSKIPIMGNGMKAADFPFIDRKNRHQAIKDLEIIDRLLRSGIVMWIAPEGTRSLDGQLKPFKKGGFITAINSKAVIIPIGIRGANKILPAKTLQINLNQHTEVHIGKPIDASDYTLETKDELIQKVHASIKQLSGQSS